MIHSDHPSGNFRSKIYIDKIYLCKTPDDKKWLFLSNDCVDAENVVRYYGRDKNYVCLYESTGKERHQGALEQLYAGQTIHMHKIIVLGGQKK